MTYAPGDDSPGARAARQYAGVAQDGLSAAEARQARVEVARRALEGSRTVDQEAPFIPGGRSEAATDDLWRKAAARDLLRAGWVDEAGEALAAAGRLYEEHVDNAASFEADLQDALREELEDRAELEAASQPYDDDDELGPYEEDEPYEADGDELYSLVAAGLEAGWVDPDGTIRPDADPAWVAAVAALDESPADGDGDDDADHGYDDEIGAREGGEW